MTIALDDLLGLGLSSRTAYLYARCLHKAIDLLEQRGTTLEECSAAHVAAIAEHWRVSHSGRAQLRAALIAGWEILGRHNPPARAVRVPPRPKTRCRALSEEAARRLEEAAYDRDDDPGLAVLIGLYAGLRRAEIASLRWEDVGLDDGTGTPAWITVFGKGGLVADVPLHPVLSDVLDRRRRRQGWVFPGRSRKTHASPATIWEWVRTVAEEAGLEQIPTHTLRHTALAEANDRSGDLRAVQEIARHSRPETTAGYTRVRWARLREVVSTIDYGRRLPGTEVA